MMSQPRPRVDPNPDDAGRIKLDTTMNIWDRPKSNPDPEPASTDVVAADFNARYQGFIYLLPIRPEDAANAADRGIKLSVGQNVWLFDPETNQRVRAKVKERLPENRGIVMTVYWGTVESCHEAPDLLPEKIRGNDKGSK